MKIVSYPANKCLVNDFNRVNFLHFNDSWPHTINYLVSVLRQHQVRYLTSIEQVIYVFQETFVYYLCVCHNEADLFTINTSLEHEIFHEILELSWPKVPSDFNLPAVNLQHV